jgi:hypothetical protein
MIGGIKNLQVIEGGNPSNGYEPNSTNPCLVDLVWFFVFDEDIFD